MEEEEERASAAASSAEEYSVICEPAKRAKWSQGLVTQIAQLGAVWHASGFSMSGFDKNPDFGVQSPNVF